MDTQQTLKCFTCERMLPSTSFHVRKTGKRGFCYDCKECRKAKHAQKTETPTQDTTPEPSCEPSIPETNSVDCHERRETIPNNIVMIAIENSPTFEHLMQIVEYTNEQLDYDALFKIVAAKFPNKYMDLFTKLYTTPEPVPMEQVPTEPVPTEEVEATTADIEVASEEPQDNYKQQYQDNPSMTEVGENVVSDEEYTTMTVRSGNEWRSIRVKRNWN